MMIRFSFKLLFTNFSTMWKVLVYYILVTLLLVGLVSACMLPTLRFIFSELSGPGNLFDHIGRLAGSFFNDTIAADHLTDITKDISNLMATFSDNSGRMVYAIVMFFVFIFMGYFLYGLVSLPATEVLNANMNSQSRYSFVGSFFSNFGKSCRLTLSRVALMVPFDLIISTVAISTLFLVQYIGIFALMLSSLFTVILLAFRLTLFSGWLPAVVTDKLGIWEGLKVGVRYVFKRFWEVFSSMIICIYLYMAVTVILAIVTFGVSFAVIAPISVVFLCLFSLVMYYGATARRYYVDYDTIISPKTLRDKNAELLYKLNQDNYYNTTGMSSEQIINSLFDDDKIITKTIEIKREIED